MARPKKYVTAEEAKRAAIEREKKWRLENRERYLAMRKKSHSKNRSSELEYNRKYANTPYGRAIKLAYNYKRHDSEKNREGNNLTPQWIYGNILFKPCAHCGKTGWDVIGCNRLDSSEPHTMDNVEPCCEDCNRDLNYEENKKGVCVHSLDGELLWEFDSISECANELGIGYGVVSSCCNNKYLREGNNVYKRKGYIISLKAKDQ